MRKLIFTIFFLATLSYSCYATTPFVGCPSDGQTGSEPAPTRPTGIIPKDPSGQLAYYQAKGGPGILAPKGWHCFALEGSDGHQLFVRPEPISTSDYFNSKPRWRGITGYGIQVAEMLGDTSGRLAVAKTVARVFPKYRSYARSVIAEGIEPAKDFPFGPYPTDKLTYRSDTFVEFTTPPNTKGIGTDSWIHPNDQSIHGTIQFAPKGDHEMTAIYLRLPAQFENLIPLILK
ncbi:MAG: hypothetical protein PW792_03350 [Acidobacteriaceae bacterium]|nr:hypothetical protein [Acidobacteriaceae bacterium]